MRAYEADTPSIKETNHMHKALQIILGLKAARCEAAVFAGYLRV